MINERIYTDILAVDCSWGELSELCFNLANEELDCDNSFEKYYSIESIVLAINRYKNHEITKKYLACWANVYNWIILASDIEKNEYAWIEKHIMYRISDWLDGVSFIDSCKLKKMYMLIKNFLKK